MGGTTFAMVVSFVLAGWMTSQVHAFRSLNENAENEPDYVTIPINGSFSMGIPGKNITACSITSPSTSSIGQIDLTKSIADARLRSFITGNWDILLNFCGFILKPVQKTDEGEWCLKYSVHQDDSDSTNYAELRGYLKVQETFAESPSESENLPESKMADYASDAGTDYASDAESSYIENLPESEMADYYRKKANHYRHMFLSNINNASDSLKPFASGLILGLLVGMVIGIRVAISRLLNDLPLKIHQ